MHAVYPKSPYGQSPNPLAVNPNSAVTQIQIPSPQGVLGLWIGGLGIVDRLTLDLAPLFPRLLPRPGPVIDLCPPLLLHPLLFDRQ